MPSTTFMNEPHGDTGDRSICVYNMAAACTYQALNLCSVQMGGGLGNTGNATEMPMRTVQQQDQGGVNQGAW